MRWLLWCFCLLAESYETINHYHYNKPLPFCVISRFSLAFSPLAWIEKIMITHQSIVGDENRFAMCHDVIKRK